MAPKGNHKAGSPDKKKPVLAVFNVKLTARAEASKSTDLPTVEEVGERLSQALADMLYERSDIDASVNVTEIERTDNSR